MGNVIDRFARVDGALGGSAAETGQVWNAPNWSVENGVIRKTSGGISWVNSEAVCDVGLPDAHVEAICAGDQTFSCLLLRASAVVAGQHYLIMPYQGVFYLYWATGNNNYVLLAEGGYPSYGQGDRLAARAAGNVITVWVNGVQVFTFTHSGPNVTDGNTSHGVAGYYGGYPGYSMWDDVVIKLPRSRVWDGTSWVRRHTKSWDGSRWVPRVVRRWNGTNWQ